MADPEQLYQEVLSEEQGKGVTPAVAEGRAKAARKRAEEGSPHPKEPKWWPGAQPHFEGGNGAAPETAEEEVAEGEVAEEAPAEEPAAEAPAEEATADKQAEEVEQEQTPAAPAAAADPPPTQEQQPAVAAPAAHQAAAAPAPAAQPAASAEPTGTIGVTHGTATGTRLRPEDEVSTEAQFEGQKAMYERRKLIDELVATGVPAVTAQDTDRPRTPWLAVLYLLIPLAVVLGLASQDNDTAAEEGTATETEAPPEGEGGGGEGGGGGLTLVAEGTQWEQDTLTFTAGEPASVEVENADPSVHNMSIYPDEESATAKQDSLFIGPDVAGGETATYEVDPLDKGEYTFICDYHTNMIGTVTVE